MAKEQIENSVGELLRSQTLTLSTAESCTGGLLGHRLTNVPGSSDYFSGGVIAYSYAAKERILNVSHDTLYDHGAVSEPTALEMARGARRLFHSDVALSITGIAGPGGGMPDKPVGLTYVALSARDMEICRQFVWDDDREGNKSHSAQAALEMLLEYLQGRMDGRGKADSKR
jgi:PncC family amidohydrolase